jgi:hypothetical protein
MIAGIEIGAWGGRRGLLHTLPPAHPVAWPASGQIGPVTPCTAIVRGRAAPRM